VVFTTTLQQVGFLLLKVPSLATNLIKAEHYIANKKLRQEGVLLLVLVFV